MTAASLTTVDSVHKDGFAVGGRFLREFLLSFRTQEMDSPVRVFRDIGADYWTHSLSALWSLDLLRAPLAFLCRKLVVWLSQYSVTLY